MLSFWWHACVTLIRLGQEPQGLVGEGLHLLQVQIPEFLLLTFVLSVFRKGLEISVPQNASHASHQPGSWPPSQMEAMGVGWGEGQMRHKLAAAVAAFWPEGAGRAHFSLPSPLPLSSRGY